MGMDTRVISSTDRYSTGISIVAQQHPCPHPEPAHHRVIRAREACDEALSFIALIQDELSYQAGTKPELRPEFWLHHLRGLTGNLLVALEAEDARHGR
jgi:hypothetical protein